MKLGTNDIGSVYLGSNAVQKVYLGANEVWTSFTGLLDDYPNAAAAYSLRLLRSAYTGSAIRVRRASDNTEQDIGFVNNVLDTATLTSFCSGTNGFVKTWYDQSANGYDATQTTAANQPQIVSSGSVINLNSKASLNFDGSNDFLNLNAVFTSDVIISGFTVVSSNNVTSNAYIYDNSLSSGIGGGYTHRFLNTGGFRIWAQDANKAASGGSTSNGVQYLSSRISTDANGETNTLFQNGSQTATNSGTPGARDAKNNTNIGRSELLSGYLNGNIQEIVVYASDQSSNRTGIELNINSFYSIY